MWAHYAEAHKGFAIGFDGTPEMLLSELQHRQLRRMTYANERPSAPTAMDLADEQVLWTKDQRWMYEDEWRIVDSSFSADGNSIDRSNNRWPFAIRPQSVHVVIYSARNGGTGSAMKQNPILALRAE